MKNIIVFKETLTYCRMCTKWMNGLCAVFVIVSARAYNYYSI